MDRDALIRTVASATVERSRELLGSTEWLPATVTAWQLNGPQVAECVVDEDIPSGGDPISATSVCGELAAGQRVMITRIRPAGLMVVAKITATPPVQWPVALLNRDSSVPAGVSGGPDLGLTASPPGGLWGEYQIDNGRCHAECQITFGAAVAGGGAFWVLRLPVPIRTNWSPFRDGPNKVIGHGWCYQSGLALHLVTVDGPLDNLDPQYGVMRIERSSSNTVPAVLGNNTPAPVGFVPSWPAGAKLTLSMDYFC